MQSSTCKPQFGVMLTEAFTTSSRKRISALECETRPARH